jgi:rhamnosyltransferase
MNLNNESFCAIFITYNPEPSIITNISRVLEQLSEVIVIDNASSSDSQKILNNLSNHKRIKLIVNEHNYGIAHALNQGAKYAILCEYKWILTFDQDSLAPPNYLNTLLSTYYSIEDRDSVGIVAPVYVTDFGTISFSNSRSKNIETYNEVKTTMTSGNLINTKMFNMVGWFNEDFFIDFVDHEYCLRLRDLGFRIIESPQALLQHSLGSSSVHYLFGISIVTTNHNSIRRYYKYRNMISILKTYPINLMSLLIVRALISEPAKILIFEQQKYQKIKSIIKGIIHGMRGI